MESSNKNLKKVALEAAIAWAEKVLQADDEERSLLTLDLLNAVNNFRMSVIRKKLRHGDKKHLN